MANRVEYHKQLNRIYVNGSRDFVREIAQLILQYYATEIQDGTAVLENGPKATLIYVHKI